MSILTALFGTPNVKIEKLESDIRTEQKKHKATRARAHQVLNEFESKTKDQLARSYKDADRRLSDR